MFRCRVDGVACERVLNSRPLPNSIVIRLPFDPPTPLPPIVSDRAPECDFTDWRLQHFCFQGLHGKNVYGLGGPLPTNTPSFVHSHISKRSTLHHFCTPTSQHDQDYSTFALPHLKTIDTPSLLHSYISNDQHSISFAFPHGNTSRLLCVGCERWAYLSVET